MYKHDNYSDMIFMEGRSLVGSTFLQTPASLSVSVQMCWQRLYKCVVVFKDIQYDAQSTEVCLYICVFVCVCTYMCLGVMLHMC